MKRIIGTVFLLMILFSFLNFKIVKAQTTEETSIVNENQSREILHPGYSGIIYKDIFSYMVPKHMVTGKSYKILVIIKNTGENSANFLIFLSAPREYFYLPYPSTRIRLGEGESRRIELLLTPIKQHSGEMNITAKLYSAESDENLPSNLVLLDSISKPVYGIKNAFSYEDIVVFFGVMILIAVGIVTIIKGFKKGR